MIMIMIMTIIGLIGKQQYADINPSLHIILINVVILHNNYGIGSLFHSLIVL